MEMEPSIIQVMTILPNSYFFRIPCCNYGERAIHERRKALLGIQNAGFRWKRKN